MSQEAKGDRPERNVRGRFPTSSLKTVFVMVVRTAQMVDILGQHCDLMAVSAQHISVDKVYSRTRSLVEPSSSRIEMKIAHMVAT